MPPSGVKLSWAASTDPELVGEPIRILERVRGVGVEKATSVITKVLDDLLGCDGTLGDELRRPLQCVHGGVPVEVLDRALRDEDDSADHGDWEQNVEDRAGDVDVEVPDGLPAMPGKPTDERDGQRNAGRCREKVVQDQGDRLREVA